MNTFWSATGINWGPVRNSVVIAFRGSFSGDILCTVHLKVQICGSSLCVPLLKRTNARNFPLYSHRKTFHFYSFLCLSWVKTHFVFLPLSSLRKSVNFRIFLCVPQGKSTFVIFLCLPFVKSSNSGNSPLCSLSKSSHSGNPICLPVVQIKSRKPFFASPQ